METNIYGKNVTKKCRVCLSENDTLVDMYEKPTTFGVSAVTAFTACTSVQITTNDVMPSLICIFCDEKLKIAYKFHTQALKSNIILNQIAQKLRSSNASQNIKWNISTKNEIFIKTEEENYSDFSTNDEKDPLLSDNAINFQGQNGLKKKETQNLIDDSYQCNVCKVAFSGATLLIEHKINHNIYQCAICDKTFKTLKNLNCHKNLHKKKHKCNLCNKRFSTTDGFKIHNRVHSGVKPYKCDNCGRLFSDRSNLKVHKMLHENKSYQCDICKRDFRHPRSLKSHKATHGDIKKSYKCDVCQQDFDNQRLLRTHKIIHTDEKPFKCNICDQIFSQLRTMKSHRRKHTGEQPYRCDVCNKQFTQIKQFNVHKRKHTGEISESLIIDTSNIKTET